MNVYVFIFTPSDLCPSWQMNQIQDIFANFSKHLRRIRVKEIIVLCLTSTLFPGYSVSFLFALSHI